MNILNTALTNMETSMAIKIECENFLFVGEFVDIVSENIEYSRALDQESWLVKEGDFWYEYSVSNYVFNNEQITDYIKKLHIEEDESNSDDSDMMSMIFDNFASSQFSSATQLGSEYTISFTVNENGISTDLSFVIENNIIKEVIVGVMGFSMVMEFKYDMDALLDIPEFPTNIQWDEYEPYIVVDGLKDYYEINEQIDIDELTIYYYEDDGTFFSEEFAVTSDMISGFSSESVCSGTITVTFYGLTFTQEYTCK